MIASNLTDIYATHGRVGRTKEYRARVSRTFTIQSALSVGGCGREIIVLATCSLQFTKVGSAATLPKQEKKQLKRGAAGQSKYYRLYLYSGKLALAAM